MTNFVKKMPLPEAKASFLQNLLFGLLDQIDDYHNGAEQNTGNGPDKPAVLRLHVSEWTEGIQHEDGSDKQPVNGADCTFDAAV